MGLVDGSKAKEGCHSIEARGLRTYQDGQAKHPHQELERVVVPLEVHVLRCVCVCGGLGVWVVGCVEP